MGNVVAIAFSSDRLYGQTYVTARHVREREAGQVVASAHRCISPSACWFAHVGAGMVLFARMAWCKAPGAKGNILRGGIQ